MCFLILFVCLFVCFSLEKGHDTTAAGITWALYCLGRYPEMQQKVHEEVDHFFGKLKKKSNKEEVAVLYFLSLTLLKNS